jgi:steroid delta-isomerase-like uncharacterized protein
MTQQATGRGIPAETLIHGTFQALVPPPAFFALANFSYQPGAFFPPAQGNGPVVFLVLDGTLEFEAEDVATKTPAGGRPQDQAPGEKFTVTVGDQLVMPGGVMHSARTIGDETARILGLAAFGAAPAQEFPPGISFAPLVLGPVGSLPDAPATARVTRLSPPAGAQVRVGGGGPRIVHVRSGGVRVELGAGEVAVWHGTGPFAPPGTLAPGEPVDLSPDDGLLLQSDATVTLTARLDDTVATVAAVTAAGAGDADEVVRGYLRHVVDAADPDAAADWVAASCRHHDRPEDQQGLDGLRAALRAELAGQSDATTTVADTFGTADVVLHRWSRTARRTGDFHGVPADGDVVTAAGLTLSRVRDRRITEDWEAEDVVEQIRQVSGTALIGDLDSGTAAGDPDPARTAATRFVYDLWHGGHLSLADELFHPDFVNHTRLPGQLAGSAGIRQFVTRWRTAFPDLAVTVDLLVAHGDRAAVRWTSRGHHLGPILGVAPSGRYVTVSGITVLAVRGGRIAESWQQWAVLSFLDQAGGSPGTPAAPKAAPPGA